MIRHLTITSLLIALCLPRLSEAMESSPPSSAIIYQTLDRLWGERKYAELDEYVQALQRKWSSYVPVVLTMAIYSYQYGAQVEDATERLNWLREKLNSDIATASPVFMELLDGRITRYERLKQFYLEQGISREQRLAERDPLKRSTFKHAKRWVGVDEMLYFNAPEVFLTEASVRLSDNGRTTTAVPSLAQIPANLLQREIADDKKPMAERKAFAQEIVRRRGAEGGVSHLVQGLRAGDSPYTYQDTVEELVTAGAASIPALIEFINNPAHFPRDQKMAIWALVRIGMIDSDVARTLQDISENADRADLAQYAQDALQYLQTRNRRSR